MLNEALRVGSIMVCVEAVVGGGLYDGFPVKHRHSLFIGQAPLCPNFVLFQLKLISIQLKTSTKFVTLNFCSPSELWNK